MMMSRVSNIAVRQLQAVSIRIAILAGSYLLLIFLVVTVEVVFGTAPFLPWAYLLCSLAYVAGVSGICFVEIARKHVAFLVAALAIPSGLLLGLIAGVGFKFLIGGSI